MHYQRNCASAFLRARLCVTFSSPDVLIPVVAPSAVISTNIRCYAVRLANVVASLSIPMICRIAQRDGWGDIVVISSIMEPDSTVTVDIGFRFPEDALIMCTKNGIKFEGRFISVQPISRLHGTCFFPSLTFSSTESGYYTLSRRYERLCTYLSLEKRICNSSPLVHQMNDLLYQFHAQTSSLSLTNTSHLTDHLLSTLETLNPSVVIYKILPPPNIPRTIYISRNIPSNIDNHTSPTLYLQLAVSDYQRDELQFDQVIPNKPISQRTRQRTINRNDVNDPSTAPGMNSRERFSALRLVFKNASEKYRVWNSPTIPLPPPPTVVDDLPGDKLIENLVTVWRWYDTAFERIKAAKSLALADPQVSLLMIEAYDAAADAFSTSTRRFGMFGVEFDALQSALKRTSSIGSGE
jgi:hypothetical protein